MKKYFAIIAGLMFLFVFAQCKKETIEEEPSTDDVELTFEVVETIANDSVSAFLDEALEGDNLNDALPVVAQRLMRMKEVTKAEVRDDDIEITFADGTSLTIMFRFRHEPGGEKPSPQENNKEEAKSVHGMSTLGRGRKALVWEPFSVELNPNGFLDLVQGMENAGMQVSSCEFNDCTIASIDTITNFDYIILHTHGSSGGNWFCTHEIVTPEKDEVYNELLASRLVGKGQVHYVEGAAQPIIYTVSGEYIRNLQGRFNNSIVFAGFCHGMDNGGAGLCNAFHDKGASVFCGFDGSVSSRYDDEIGTALTEHLVYDRMSMGEAYDLVRNDIPDRPRYDSDGNILTPNMFRMDERSDRNTNLFEIPVIQTLPVGNITATTAIFKGIITSGEFVQRGFCFGTTPNVTVDGIDSQLITVDGNGLWQYDYLCEGLIPNTTYYVRAFARNEYDEITYGEELSFTTINDVPRLITLDAYNVTAVTALLRGSVVGETSQTVTEHGFCYGTVSDQGIGNYGSNKIIVGSGMGSFMYNLEGLTPATTYYVNTYAITDLGYTVYGEEKSFTTINDDPQVMTLEVDNVTDVSVVLRGGVVGETSQTVTERGFCYGTTTNQGIGNYGSNKIVVGSGMGNFFYNLENLLSRKRYYVKAYAITDLGHTIYGDQISFVTLGAQGPEGTVRGLFSVSSEKQVWFSKGNLQYQASTNTWRFAEHQYDYVGGDDWYWGTNYGTVVGSNNDNASETYSGWIDMFAWGASGYNHGAVCYQPWSHCGTEDYWAYGDPNAMLSDQTGKADWGCNAISNGGNQENQWRTLSMDEWYYLFNSRSTSSGIRFVGAIVNDVNGLIILPDDWNASEYQFSNHNSPYYDYYTNVVSLNDWETVLEPAGAVFLPCGGARESSMTGMGSDGYYWTTNPRSIGTYTSFCVKFTKWSLMTDYYPYRNCGASVRLVQDD